MNFEGKINRRDVLVGIGGIVAGIALVESKVLYNLLMPEAEAKKVTPTEKIDIPDVPWGYKKSDPKAVAERAYKAFYSKKDEKTALGCMYGVFEGIIGELKEKVGFPYDKFPSKMMEFGKMGMQAWGSLCGALNGAVAAMNLTIGGDLEPLVNELFVWYEQTNLPDYTPQKHKFDIKKSIADSTLCHISVSNWCKVSGFKSFSPERIERCAWLVASVAKKTVELLNMKAEGKFKSVHPIKPEVITCLACHGKGGMLENTKGKMNCSVCHKMPKGHPAKK